MARPRVVARLSLNCCSTRLMSVRPTAHRSPPRPSVAAVSPWSRTGRAAALNTENQRLLFTRAHENDHSLPKAWRAPSLPSPQDRRAACSGGREGVDTRICTFGFRNGLSNFDQLSRTPFLPSLFPRSSPISPRGRGAAGPPRRTQRERWVAAQCSSTCGSSRRAGGRCRRRRRRRASLSRHACRFRR